MPSRSVTMTGGARIRYVEQGRTGRSGSETQKYPFPADLSAPCRHDDSIPSSPTVLPASPSGGFHRQCVWFHHLSYPFPRVIRWARSLR